MKFDVTVPVPPSRGLMMMLHNLLKLEPKSSQPLAANKSSLPLAAKMLSHP
jgi:hypothetical protein